MTIQDLVAKCFVAAPRDEGQSDDFSFELYLELSEDDTGELITPDGAYVTSLSPELIGSNQIGVDIDQAFYAHAKTWAAENDCVLAADSDEWAHTVAYKKREGL